MAKIFCINSVPRAGTHMLGTALNAHPAMHVYGEIFNKNHHDGQVFENETVPQALRRMRQRKDVKQIGFCVHRGAVPAVEREVHREAEKKLPAELRTIILWRENYFRQFVSLRRAQAVGAWTVEQGWDMPEYVPVTLTVDETQAFFKRMMAQNGPPTRRYKRAVRVSYEQLIADFQSHITRVLKFLGVRVIPLVPVTVKTGVPLRQAVTNYDELKMTFAKTQWSNFFDE